jgi:predicted nucleic acid-binding protein
MKIYIDSNVLISSLQPEPNTRLAHSLLDTTTNDENTLVASVIIYGEVLTAKSSLVKIQNFLDLAPIQYITVDLSTVKVAAKLRKNHPGLHLADAIHLATAINESCDRLITDDKKLQNICKRYLPAVSLIESNL